MGNNIILKKIIIYIAILVIILPGITVPQKVYAAEPAEILLEAEDFVEDAVRLKENEFASGGKVVQYSWVGSFEPVIEITFNVDISNYYTMTFDAALEWNGNYDMSPLYFAINNGDEDLLHIGNATETEKDNLYLDNTFKVREIQLNNPIYLEQGSNTIMLRIPKRYSGDAVFSVIDCIRLKREEVIQSIGSRGILEAEDFVNDSSRIKENEFASGGKVVQYSWVSSFEPVIEMTFEIEESNYYTIILDVALEWDGKYEMSPLYFSVNNEDEIKIDESNAVRNEKANIYLDSAFRIAEIKLNDPIYLPSGQNTITLHIPKRGGSYNDAAFSAIDCVTLKKQQSIQMLKLQIDNEVKRGLSSEILLINQDGSRVFEDELESMEVDISDERIVQINKDKIRAINYGNVMITVHAKTADNLFTLSKELHVINENGLYVSEANILDGRITINFQSIEDYPGGDYLLIAVYEDIDGIHSSLKAVKQIKLEMIEQGDTMTIDQQIDDISETDIICAYIIDKENEHRSIYNKIYMNAGDES